MVQVEDELPDGKEEVVIKALDGLKPLYKEVLVYRFGLSGQAPLSLQAISDKYGVTRERIRQIEAYALEELRLSKASNHLMEYWPAPQYLPDYTEKYLPK
jgi:RNA polymerase sigma factor (sigma-70 family)